MIQALRTKFNLSPGFGDSKRYLPPNFLRTAFGLNSHPYQRIEPCIEYPAIDDAKNDIFRHFSLSGHPHIGRLGGQRLVEPPSVSAISTENASAMGVEFTRFGLKGTSDAVIYSIHDEPFATFAWKPKPVCFLLEAVYEPQGLRVIKMHIPDLERSITERKYFSPELNGLNLERALYYATLCRDDLAAGETIVPASNMKKAEQASDIVLHNNFAELKTPRSFSL